MDEEIIEQIKRAKTNGERWELAQKLQTDQARMQVLELNLIKNNSITLATFIASFEDDSLKVDLMRKYKTKLFRFSLSGHSGSCKNIIIESIKDDKLKEELLKEVKNINFRVRIICSFQSDSLKKKYIETIPDDITQQKLKTKIIRTYESDELKEEYLKQIHDPKYREDIIVTFKGKEFVERYKNEITDERKRAELTGTLDEYNERVRVEELKREIKVKMFELGRSYEEEARLEGEIEKTKKYLEMLEGKKGELSTTNLKLKEEIGTLEKELGEH